MNINLFQKFKKQDKQPPGLSRNQSRNQKLRCLPPRYDMQTLSEKLLNLNPSLLTIFLHLLAQRLPLHVQQFHDLLTALPKLLAATFPNIVHGLHDSLQLVWQPCDNGTAASGSGMRCLLQDVLAGEAPVSPSKVTDLVQGKQVQRCRRRVL